MSKGQPRTYQSPNLEDVPSVCCWASGRQSTLCGTFAVSLLPEVCSCRVVAVYPACSAHMTIQRGVPFTGAMRKCQFWWRIHEPPVCSFFMRYEGRPIFNLVHHFIQFFFPPVLHFSLPFVGISFSQDQVTWLKQYSISLSVAVTLLLVS